METWFERLAEISTTEQKILFKKDIEEAGFSAINQLIGALNTQIKKMDEKEFKLVKDWLELGKELLPDLVSVSPVWKNTWEDFLDLYRIKVELFLEVPEEERDGEWQVLFDNPFTIHEVVCTPNKTFTEASYLMAKYQLNMKKAEIVKLQKITTTITKKGK